jgi:Ca-activated chloride channel family protein
MNLQSAGALLWLLPLGGIIVALYLLRMRRKDVHVPATFLWPERTDEVRANALFQRLRFSWLLILQLLALTLFVFALARPQTLQKGLAGTTTVVVLDASASMGATDVKPTRFDSAIETVEGMIASANPGDQLMLIEAGPYPRVVFPLSADPAAQRRSLQTLRRSDAPSDIEEALRLATARVGKIEGAKIVLLSDGVFAEVENFSAGQASLVYNKIGEQRNNVAIEALGSTVGPEGRVVFCGVKNHALDEKTVTIDVLADGEVINSAKATIGSNKSWGNTFPSPPGTKVIEARITSNDILAADDYAATVIDPGASLRVLLVTPGDIFLERALSLDPRVTLDKAPKVPEAEQQGTAGPGSYDVVVFAGTKEAPVKARAVLTFGQAGPSSNVTPNGRSRSFDFLRAEQHDIMRGVDMRNVYIENVEKVAPKAAGRVVAEGRTGPLIVVSETDKRQVYVAFSPLDSDFPLTVGFPIFVANALDFLAGNTVSDSFAILAGQQFQLPADTDEAATLERPDGGKMEIEPLQGRYIVRGVDQVGTYKLTAGEREVTVRANMRDDRESSVNAQDFVSIKKQQVQAVQDLRRYADFWKPLALLALCVLAVEWWMYARRS